MVLPSASFNVRCEPMPPLTGHGRSFTSSTVPLNIASADLSYLGTVSWAGFCAPKAATVAIMSARMIGMRRQVFMFVLLAVGPKLWAWLLPELWREACARPVIEITRGGKWITGRYVVERAWERLRRLG